MGFTFANRSGNEETISTCAEAAGVEKKSNEKAKATARNLRI
jgi:hypothetical protein